LAFDDPEVVGRTDDPFHAGLVLRSPDSARIRALLDSYAKRFSDDFVAVAPHYALPPLR
jgi:hypothetical protein